MKKTLAILLSLALVICMLPGAAFADDTIDLSGATITLSNTSVVYNGQKQVPTVTVKVGDTVLEENKDYTLSWDREPKEVGEYTLTVSGSGNYSGSKTGLKFLITKLNLSNSNVSIKEITPVTSVENAKTNVKAFVGEIEISSGEYTITTEASGTDQVKVIVTANSDATNLEPNSSRTALFHLKQVMDPATWTVTGTKQTYSGKPLSTTLTIQKDGKTQYLSNGTDYDVAYSNNINKGTASITVTGKGKYTGTITGSFEIVARSLSGASAKIPNVIAGNKIVPEVKLGDTILRAGTDYTYVEPNTSTAGTGTIDIIGINNYTGTISRVPYKVIALENTFNQTNVIDNKITPYYNGSTQYASITVKVGNRTLSKGSDYDVEYSYWKNGKHYTTTAPKDAGYYNYTINGKGNYAGTVTGDFTIKAVPLDWAQIVLSSSTVLYDGVYVPKVMVRHISGNFYFNESDYVVTYKNLKYNSAYLRPTAVVTPAANGNLTAGSTVKQLEKEITYEARNIANCAVNFTDYKSSKNYDGTTVRPTVTVRDYSLNRTLVLNSDYTVTYKDAAGKTVSGLQDAGVYTVVVTGAGAYSGSTTLTYTINGIDISGYTVTLKEDSVKADGYSKKPSIVSVKKDFYKTVSSSDYTVSYEDSTGKTVYTISAPGTYKVVVTGKNGYTGKTYATYRVVGTPQTMKIAKTAYKVYTTSEPFKISATATGDGTGFSYTSNNPSVATVSSTGVVTVHKLGRAVITVTTIGNKKSDPVSDEVYVKVHPRKTTISKKPWNDGKAAVRVRWNKQDDVTKYQIKYSRDKSFKSGTYKVKTVEDLGLNYTTQSTKLSGLKKGARYYIKVRAIKEVYNENGTKLTYYGTWSNWRSVVVKK